MEPKTPALTAYDIMGYIVPGLGALALVDLSVVYHQNKIPLNYDLLYLRYGNLSWTSLPPLFLVAYFLGHIISFTSSALLENHAKWLHGHPSRYLLGSKVAGYFETQSGCKKTSQFLRLLAAIVLLPVTSLDFFFSKCVKLSKNYTCCLDETVRDAVKKAFRDLYARLGLDYPPKDDEGYEEDIPRLALHDAFEAAHGHVVNLRNYVVLYGFLRSMTLLVVAIGWGAFGHSLAFVRGSNGSWQEAAGILLLAASSACVAGFVCYLTFFKFWARYHQEALMAFVAAYANRDHRAPEKEQTQAKLSLYEGNSS